mmetsp:Transcript_20989/g.31523  ORF Transcript_20989/g.31523 Transcript_20989/m.31523 type:complete len:216 (-) Transcript_20989:898-1545(-)
MSTLSSSSSSLSPSSSSIVTTLLFLDADFLISESLLSLSLLLTSTIDLSPLSLSLSKTAFLLSSPLPIFAFPVVVSLFSSSPPSFSDSLRSATDPSSMQVALAFLISPPDSLTPTRSITNMNSLSLLSISLSTLELSSIPPFSIFWLAVSISFPSVFSALSLLLILLSENLLLPPSLSLLPHLSASSFLLLPLPPLLPTVPKASFHRSILSAFVK